LYDSNPTLSHGAFARRLVPTQHPTGDQIRRTKSCIARKSARPAQGHDVVIGRWSRFRRSGPREYFRAGAPMAAKHNKT
jgi:hypothetical protein